MKKQSSIDFLIKQLGIKKDGWNNSVIKQAKQMHKQEILDAHKDGGFLLVLQSKQERAEKYYNKTFETE